MLVKCPECELQCSNQALSCPHCGYPLQRNIKPRKSNRRKRLPNGFGQISEIKNQNLRKPFRAMVTVGKTEYGRPICKTLKPECYFNTYNEAYLALLEYNRNPYDLSSSINMLELYEKWSEEYFKKLKAKSSIRTITSSWKYCSSVYKMRVTDIRGRHIKSCMEEAPISIKPRVKSLFNLLLDYALEYEIVDKNYARTFKISEDVKLDMKENKKDHIAFTDEEMEILWSKVYRIEYVDVILIQCYSGWRPQELGLLEIANMDLDNWTFVGGMKTTAGTNRTVPIHPKIRELVLRRYNEAVKLNSKYLINCNGGKLTYSKYSNRFGFVRDLLNINPNHRPHDGRVQFVTMAKKYGVDEYAIKYMVGHAINDITEQIYTERKLDWLQSEIQKIR